MTTNPPTDHALFEELAFLEADGELTSVERRRLDEHALRCASCRALRTEGRRLAEVLESAAIQPDPDFAAQVMSELPAAAWEMRRPAAWRLPAALVLLLAGVGSWLAVEGTGLEMARPWLATAGAVLEFFRSAALAGAGLLSASWAGMGLALAELSSLSRIGFLVFGIFVLGVDFLFLRYLRARSTAAAGARSGRSGREGRSSTPGGDAPSG